MESPLAAQVATAAFVARPSSGFAGLAGGSAQLAGILAIVPEPLSWPADARCLPLACPRHRAAFFWPNERIRPVTTRVVTRAEYHLVIGAHTTSLTCIVMYILYLVFCRTNVLCCLRSVFAVLTRTARKLGKGIPLAFPCSESTMDVQ